MFLHLSVILFTGGRWRGSLSRGVSVTETPHMVEERAVRILLECILVQLIECYVGSFLTNIGK